MHYFGLGYMLTDDNKSPSLRDRAKKNPLAKHQSSANGVRSSNEERESASITNYFLNRIIKK